MAGALNVSLQQVEHYRFANAFGHGAPVLMTDEPPPLGEDSGPSPSQLLVAAAANCLCASLLFAFGKFKQDVAPLSAEASCVLGRNAEQRLRIESIAVTLKLGKPAATLAQLERVLASFENYCTVTQSIRQGITVDVVVLDVDGSRLK
ncbi:OsmC family protein [Craterilacuibacter sp. RT1T]|uniref:OsmC family protein n=1 Tax=Craterilacuibacter sp. RT1T TaxID=2942211 RepID=UPI0020BD49BA|nr:OsmC family protein [Craterilacuibacter sp. RT1T]MCL6263068.1 OsmC family protein [Craterilacuibacter sp. RT1T]